MQNLALVAYVVIAEVCIIALVTHAQVHVSAVTANAECITLQWQQEQIAISVVVGVSAGFCHHDTVPQTMQ